jgi:hypothetical protein
VSRDRDFSHLWQDTLFGRKFCGAWWVINLCKVLHYITSTADDTEFFLAFFFSNLSLVLSTFLFSSHSDVQSLNNHNLRAVCFVRAILPLLTSKPSRRSNLRETSDLLNLNGELEKFDDWRAGGPHIYVLAARGARPGRLANERWTFSYERWLASNCNGVLCNSPSFQFLTRFSKPLISLPLPLSSMKYKYQLFLRRCGVRLSVQHWRCRNFLFSTVGGSHSWVCDTRSLSLGCNTSVSMGLLYDGQGFWNKLVIQNRWILLT